MSNSNSFEQLHPAVKRWIWQQKWEHLRDIQEQSIDPILKGESDVIISASTASGKTEAAFLPAISATIENPRPGIRILYISPLKALINDQHRRLENLCELADLPLTPWHGDVRMGVKQKLKKNPAGVLLITPESLEALFINQSNWLVTAFANLEYIILDEFHAFIGSERGCQLQSLLTRLEFLTKKTIPRIALSATLSELDAVENYLRPHKELPCQIVASTTSQSDLKLQVRGYQSPRGIKDYETLTAITDDLFTLLRGKSNLAFANSRALTETLTASLSDKSATESVPNEFFAHHGNLSKELRESLERRLQEGKKPTTSICTMTLELGIDIGDVYSIAQITPPHSIASMRQRLGRSGRRGDAAILRMFIPEATLNKDSDLIDRLRIQTIQCGAMINLLLQKWYEPPDEHQYHFSTLVQQTLSVTAQYGGVTAKQLYALLCQKGPFTLVSVPQFMTFLKELGAQDLITQMQDGQITLGKTGELVAGHYTFYTAFQTPEEYRLEHSGKPLGTIPFDMPVVIGQQLIFAGQRWEITNVDSKAKIIQLIPMPGGEPPVFDSGGGMLHDRIRQEMLSIYKNKSIPVYLDRVAKESMQEGVDCFQKLSLANNYFVEEGNKTYLLLWRGDKITQTISALLRMHELQASDFGGVIEINQSSKQQVVSVIKTILQQDAPTPLMMAVTITDTLKQKHDERVDESLRQVSYGAEYFDIPNAIKTLKQVIV